MIFYRLEIRHRFFARNENDSSEMNFGYMNRNYSVGW